jgi:hypothetical protein
MIAMELLDAMDRVEELQSMNYNMLDYLRTQLTRLLEYCEKNRIPLPDLEKAILFFKIPVKFDPTNTYRLLRTAHPTKRSTEPFLTYLRH